MMPAKTKLTLVAGTLLLVAVVSIGVGAVGVMKGTRPTSFYESRSTSRLADAEGDGTRRTQQSECEERAHSLIVRLNRAARAMAYFTAGVGLAIGGMGAFVLRLSQQTRCDGATNHPR
jgi:hypothetical protein